MPLVALVAGGTVVVTLAGGALFLWLAWLLSHRPAPSRDNTGYWTWLSHVDGSALFDAARTSATLLAVVGIGGAALVAYRRQDTAERAHEVAIEGQRIANDQLTLDSQKYDLDRDRHGLDVDLRKDDRERDFRSRFASIAEQLGSKTYAVRHAGAYALAALADDWHQLGNDAERQVCVNLLCAQLRSPPEGDDDAYMSDLEVRQTMISLIRSHRPLEASSELNWKSCSISLVGAVLRGGLLSESDLAAADLSSADLTNANLTGANLATASMNMATIDGTNFSKADLTDARLLMARGPEQLEPEESAREINFHELNFRGAKLRRAWLHNAKLFGADFKGADLTGAIFYHVAAKGVSFRETTAVGTSFGHAELADANFSYADLSGADLSNANTTGARFENTRFDDATKWPDDVVPVGAVKDGGGPSTAPEA
jgi:uncharacterized protein YjbI with pentapeptide repeats